MADCPPGRRDAGQAWRRPRRGAPQPPRYRWTGGRPELAGPRPPNLRPRVTTNPTCCPSSRNRLAPPLVGEEWPEGALDAVVLRRRRAGVSGTGDLLRRPRP